VLVTIYIKMSQLKSVELAYVNGYPVLYVKAQYKSKTISITYKILHDSNENKFYLKKPDNQVLNKDKQELPVPADLKFQFENKQYELDCQMYIVPSIK